MTDMHSLAGEYAVGSLTPEEIEQYEAHLATCPSCREEVADMRDIAAQLSEAVATDPPATLRESVLAQIAQTPQHPAATAETPGYGGTAATGGAALGSATAPSVTTSQGSTSSNVIPMQRRGMAGRATGLMAAAALVAAVAMGGWALSNRNEARDATARAEQLTALLAAGDVRTVSSEFATGGEGTVVLSASRGEALLVTAELPELSGDEVYQAWTGKESMEPAGVVADDPATNVVELPDQALDADQIAVTVEPTEGLRAPTTDPVFLVDLPSA